MRTLTFYVPGTYEASSREAEERLAGMIHEREEDGWCRPYIIHVGRGWVVVMEEVDEQ